MAMRNERLHRRVVEQLQKHIQKNHQDNKPLSLLVKKGYSNTTRSKSYKKRCAPLPCGAFNKILSVDVEKRRVRTQPRTTMEDLIKATLPYGLIPPVVPEFKGI